MRSNHWMEEQYELDLKIKILKKREQTNKENYLLQSDRNLKKKPT